MLNKLLILATLSTLGVYAAPRSALLGAKECTWGPSYWCKNLTSAHGCNAVRHCISNVWEHKSVPTDPDDVCTLCKKMVGEARDQLQSNMTMEELKEVLDGSCKLMILKPAVELCTKLTNELVPELVDTITSQMNPDVVCSVAGLCNNAEIDAAIAEDAKSKNPDQADKSIQAPADMKADYMHQNCDMCNKFANRVAKRITDAKPEDLLSYLLDLCGKTSSYSDSCASLVLMHQDSLLPALQTPFTSQEFCLISGSCLSARKPMPGDETCDLCQQLVLHFKDIVTANTTEAEFKKVLLGVCKQTKKFAPECEELVNQYSDEVFNMISNDLDGKKICGFLNICPAPGVFYNGPTAPMLPAQPMPVITGKVSVEQSGVQVRVMTNDNATRPAIVYGDKIGKSELEPMPAELLIGKPAQSLLDDIDVNGQETCVFCQYLLHYVQKMISQPYGADAIKKVVDKFCDELPSSTSLQCRNFVNLYGDAFVAILAQEIDPSQVCPSLKVCPAELLADKYAPESLTGVPGCPLCLMVIRELTQELANNKTEDSVKAALDRLCHRLPRPVVDECTQIVDTYTEQIVDMVLADFTPEEVCTFLKICGPSPPPQVELVPKTTPNADYGILTNEVDIPESRELLESSESMEAVQAGPGCILCEFVMEKVDDFIRLNKTQVDIDLILNGICNEMPRTVRAKCERFVVKYAEEIINTLAVMVPPSEVCSYMGLCLKTAMEHLKATVSDCHMCTEVAGIHKILARGENADVDRARFLMMTCDGVDYDQGDKCRSYMRLHGVSMFNALKSGQSTADTVCGHLSLCTPAQSATVEFLPEGKRNPAPLGANKCTHGPGYWCKSRANAKKCGEGAVKHCQEKVWPF